MVIDDFWHIDLHHKLTKKYQTEQNISHVSYNGLHYIIGRMTKTLVPLRGRSHKTR
jgi:hypothetical protein